MCSINVSCMTQLRVEDFQLCCHNYVEISFRVFQQHQLTDLNAGYNKLTVVPPEIGQLTALMVLDLRYSHCEIDFSGHNVNEKCLPLSTVQKYEKLDWTRSHTARKNQLQWSDHTVPGLGRSLVDDFPYEALV